MDPVPAPFPPRLAVPCAADAPFEAVIDAADLPLGAMRRVSRGDLDLLIAHTPNVSARRATTLRNRLRETR